MSGRLLLAALTLALYLPTGAAVPQRTSQDKAAVHNPDPPTPWFNKDEDTFDLPADPQHVADLKRDAADGRKEALEVIKVEGVSTDMALQERVERIGQQIAHIANHMHAVAQWGDKRFSPYHYRYTVIKGDEPNAFSLPGGYIFVYEGLFKYIESDDELAGVLAHETAHAAFRHVATLQHMANKALLLEIPVLIASILSHSLEGAEIGQLALRSFVSGWSISAEKAADYGGLQFMVHSHYNPVAMLTFMEKLVTIQRLTDLFFNNTILQTHPVSRQRAQYLVEGLHQFGIPIERSKATPEYRVAYKTDKEGAVEISYLGKHLYSFSGEDAQARAHATGSTLNHFFDQVPEMYEIGPSRDGDAVAWKREPLIQIESEDAQAQGIPVDKLLAKTVENVKQAVFLLRSRVWESFD